MLRFYVAAVGFAAGIGLRSFLDYGFWSAMLFLILALSLLVLKLIQPRGAFENRKIFIAVGAPLFFLAAALGVIRMEFASGQGRDAILENFIGEEVVLEGVVADEPDERERSTLFTARLEFLVGETPVKVQAKILATTDIYKRLTYGDRVRLRGELSRPKNFETDNGREFDYQAYLAKDGIFYNMAFPQIEVVGQGEGSLIVGFLFSVKRTFLANLERLIPDPHVSLLGGLLVGAKQSLGVELQDKFRTVGLTHIVVLSGYNVSLIADAAMRLFSLFLGSAVSLALSALSIILFAIMVGGSATVVRASIMALLVVLARATGRSYAIVRALVVAGLLMLLHNPRILVFDPSFQLSFLATLGLIVFSPLLQKRLTKVPEFWKLRETAAATISTQIFVLPFLLYLTGGLSLVALPANMAVLMAVPATMFFGFVTGAVGLISSALTAPFSWITYALLAYELTAVKFFASLPFASVDVPKFSFVFLLIIYGTYSLVWRQIEATHTGRVTLEEAKFF